MNFMDLAQKSKLASTKLLSISEEKRIFALEILALNLIAHEELILEVNQLDINEAQKNKLSAPLIDRLKLTSKSIQNLAQMCLDVACQEQVVGVIDQESKRPNGLMIQKARIPIGVILMIFESRPNVLIDATALGIKSGNAMILKGGKEASYTNHVLFEIINHSLQDILPPQSYSFIESREMVDQLLELDAYIDLVVPRGGSALVNHVKKNASMPVIAHDKGLCHLYVHEDAPKAQVMPVILNAKTSRPGVCNALESLLLHENYSENKKIIESLIQAGVEIRGCPKTQKLYPKVIKATPEDYFQEYLAMKISVKIVTSHIEAIEHIQKHSSHHTEAILAQDPLVIELFLNHLDSSCLIVNASTRFNDGGELGLGAELGISTSKLHAYGPMGAREMTTTRFIVKGNGQIR